MDSEKSDMKNESKKIASSDYVKKTLSSYGIRPKKGLGQNFLIDSRVIKKIAEALRIDDEETILEIGPGIGALTEALLEQGGKVIAIEIDRDMALILQETLVKRYRSLKVVNEDFLKSHWTEFGAKKIVGNLPYYITTPILLSVFREKAIWEDLIFTLQWEVVKRLVAKPSDKDYSALSAIVQCFGMPTILQRLPPHCFMPQPDVHSGVVAIKKRSLDLNERGTEILWSILDNAFKTRRKTLKNNLNAILPPGFASDIDLSRRAEALSYKEFIHLAKELNEYENVRKEN